MSSLNAGIWTRRVPHHLGRGRTAPTRWLGAFAAIAAAVAVAGCGASTVSTPQTTTAAAATAPAAERDAKPLVYAENPSLSAYVNGPWPVNGRTMAYPADPDAAYRAEIVVINTGDSPAEIDDASIWLRAVREPDEALDCEPVVDGDEVDVPEMLQPGQAHTFVAVARCPFSRPGHYEVQAYMSFGARGGDVDVSRYYVGSYDITVGPPRAAG